MQKQITAPEADIVAMVNGAQEARRQLEAVRKDQLRQEAKRRVQHRIAIGRMVLEAGTYAALGALVLEAMRRGMIVPALAWPVAVVCLIWAAIRVDRQLRRRGRA